MFANGVSTTICDRDVYCFSACQRSLCGNTAFFRRTYALKLWWQYAKTIVTYVNQRKKNTVNLWIHITKSTFSCCNGRVSCGFSNVADWASLLFILKINSMANKKQTYRTALVLCVCFSLAVLFFVLFIFFYVDTIKKKNNEAAVTDIFIRFMYGTLNIVMALG